MTPASVSSNVLRLESASVIAWLFYAGWVYVSANSGSFAGFSTWATSGVTELSIPVFLASEGAASALTLEGFALYLLKSGLVSDWLSFGVDGRSLVYDAIWATSFAGEEDGPGDIGPVAAGADVGANIVGVWASLADAHARLYG
jgi:hypothetical protein